MDAELKGKKALITGGASGIGLGIAQALADEGVDLCVASRHPSDDAVEDLRSHGIQCHPIHVDVSTEGDAVRMVNEAIAYLGHLDFYINNAAWNWHESILKLTTEAIENTLHTNLMPCMWASREVCNHLVSRGTSGGILIIGSTSRLSPGYNESAYRISKSALYSFMESLSIEMAPYGIRVNTITPGHFQTRLTSSVPQEAEQKLIDLMLAPGFGESIQVGYAAAFLLSDRLSGYTWGSELIIDGGLRYRPLKLFDE